MISHFLKLDSPDGSTYSLHRIVDQLTNRLYLAQWIDFKTGEPNGMGAWVVDIKMLSEFTTDDFPTPRGLIFETWLALQEYLNPEPSESKSSKAPGPTLQ